MNIEYSFHFKHGCTIVETPTGYVLRSLGRRQFCKKGIAVRLFTDDTDEQMMLSEILAGQKFVEFDPVQLFGTDKPAGSQVAAWLKTLWGTGEVYKAMQWVKETVPLDVLLGFGGPLPGVTADPQTGWHWSSSMQATRSPKFFESRKAFKKYVHSKI